MTLRTCLALAAALLPAVAWSGPLELSTQAQAPVYVPPAAVSTPDLVFTVRGGVAMSPDYFGSSDYTVGPDFALSFGYLNIPGWRSFGTLDGAALYGVAPRVSFRYVDERDSGDNAELVGLDDIDRTFELGAGLGYQTPSFGAFADLRYGIGGHETFVGELGADVKVYPTDRLQLTAGPRVLLGTDDYASTYFGISPEEAAVSQFGAYDADGGVISAGVELGARYEVSPQWGVEGAVTYDRFVGDAADSPIVENGERDQYGIRLGVTRQITLDF